MTNYVHIHEKDFNADVRQSQSRWRHWIPVILLAWVSVVSVLTLLGLFDYLPIQFIAPLAALGIMVPVVLYKQVRSLNAYLSSRSLDYFTTFHLWRIGAAALFFWYGSQDMLPEVFVRHAAWGDLLAGLLVFPILLSRSKTVRKYLIFHVVGFLDFILAVGTGLYFTMVADPAMTTIAQLPLILIPLFGVSISGASHIIAFDVIRQRIAVPGSKSAT